METSLIIGERSVYDDETTKIKYFNRIEYRDKNDRLHRLDGPALERFRTNNDGSSIYITKSDWLIHGVRHRENGPAIELANGNKYFYKNGRRHREDGPALIDYEILDNLGYPHIEFWMNGVFFPGVKSVEEMIIKNIIE